MKQVIGFRRKGLYFFLMDSANKQITCFSWAISGKDFTVIEYACLDAPRGMGSPHSCGRSYCGDARPNAGIPSASPSVPDHRFTLGGLQNDWTDKTCLSG